MRARRAPTRARDALAAGRLLVTAALLGGVGCGGGAGGGGAPRQESDFPATPSVNDVWAFAPDLVWAVGAQGEVFAFDGATWSSTQTPTTSELTGIFAFDEDDVWVSASSEILHWNGVEWSSVEMGSGLVDVYGADGHVWAVGDNSSVHHWDGSTWSVTYLSTSFNSAVWASGPADVWVQGVFGLEHFDGTAWTEVDPGTSGEGGLFGFGPNDVWVATDSEELAHWDGSTWTLDENEDFVGSVASVWGAAPNDLWGVGTAGSISHYDGTRWREIRHQRIGSPELQLLTAVHGSSSNDVWMVGRVLGANGNGPLVFHHGP